MADVVLVLMPYVSIERPSLALATLRPALLDAGIATRELYGNLRFAGEIGLTAYENINSSTLSHRLGEWTFAAAAFPDADLRPAQYLENLTNLLGDPPGLVEQLLAVREMAGRFVDRVAQRILEWRPRIVGCSSVFQQQCASLALLRRIRELDPSVVTILGGGNCEGSMGQAAHQGFEWLDFVVSGEADDLFAPLCQHIMEGGPDLPSTLLPPGVLGPVHRTGLAQLTPPPAPTYAQARRLDRLPVPDFDEYFVELKRSGLYPLVMPAIPIETSRGCWWGEKAHCKFCGISESAMVFRSKPAERVLREMDYLRERHGIRRFMAADNIIEPSYFDALMPTLAAAGRDYSIFYQTKANLTRRQVALMAKAGVRWIQPGIENLHDGVLSLLHKGASAAINVQLLKWARIHGVWVMWNMLFGAPGEEDRWYGETADWLPLISHLQPPAATELTAIRYNRFSPYFNQAESYGLDLEPYWSYAFTYPHEVQRRAEQAYYFLDKNDVGKSQHLEARPGAQRLNDRVRQWSSLFFDSTLGPLPTVLPGAPSVLLSRSRNGTSVIDTRPIASSRRHELTALEARVLRACDSASTPKAIDRSLKPSGEATAVELDSALQSLSTRGLLLELGGRFLSLALEEPPAPYQDPSCFPAGFVLSSSIPEPISTPPEPPSPWEQPLAGVFGGALEERP